MGLITLHNFTALDVESRIAYLERHPEDTRFAPDTIREMYPEFTQEYLETLKGMWPSWDEDHKKSWRTLAHERNDLDIADRLFREGFTEFKHTPDANATGRPHTFRSQLYGDPLYGDPYPSVRLLRARNPETGKTASYQYIHTEKGARWINETKLYRETRAAEEVKEYIADRLEYLLAMGEYPDTQTLREDAKSMAADMARALMPRMHPDAYKTINGFVSEFSDGELADLVEKMPYDKRIRFITDAARVYGQMEEGYTLGGFVAKINMRLDDILRNVNVHELLDCGKRRQEAEMALFMDNPYEISMMLRYPGSSTNIDYAASFFYDVLAAKAAEPGRSLSSIMNPEYPTVGFLGDTKSFNETVGALCRSGRKEELRDYIDGFVHAVLPAGRQADWVKEYLFKKIDSDITHGRWTEETGSFNLNCLYYTALAAAREDFSREEVEKTVDVCLSSPQPGFYGFKTKTLAEYIADQDADTARAIISSEEPEKAAGIMRARAYIERKIQQIEKDEAAVERAEAGGGDASSLKERLTCEKLDLAQYVSDRLSHIGAEYFDDLLLPQEQGFIMRICREDSHNWTLDGCRDSMEHFQTLKTALDSCIYLDHGIAVYMVDGRDADGVSVSSPFSDYRPDAAVTLDTSTGHIYVAYRDSADIPEGARFEEMEQGALMYRVDMTQELGGPATPETYISKVTKCARTVMESISPATDSLSRMEEVVEMGKDLSEKMQDIFREERTAELLPGSD